jgi:hypothetical protein
MTLQDWIDTQWRLSGETRTRALERLSLEWGLTYKTLFYAARGARVSPDTARTIDQRTGGAVPAESLVMNPTRAELEAGHTSSLTPALPAVESAS